MSQLQYSSYPGWGSLTRQPPAGYSQVVRVGDRLEASGQGGWDPNASSFDVKFSKDLTEEIGQAFANVDIALKDAGGKGWSQVFRVNSYHTTELDFELFEIMISEFKKWMPDHMPIWTEVGVRQLGAPGMRVEIEVSAYDGSDNASKLVERGSV